MMQLNEDCMKIIVPHEVPVEWILVCTIWGFCECAYIIITQLSKYLCLNNCVLCDTIIVTQKDVLCYDYIVSKGTLSNVLKVTG